MLKNKFILISLLGGTFVLMILLSVIGGAVVSFASSSPSNIQTQTASIPKVSSELQNQLSTAFKPSIDFNFDEALDPFNDKIAYKGQATTAEPQNLNIPSKTVFGKTSNIPFPNNNTLSNGLDLPKNPPSGPTNSKQGEVVNSQVNLPSQVTVPGFDKEAFQKERNARLRAGRSVADLVSVEDLRPFGTVGSGNQNYVKLIANSTNDKITVSLGTRFSNGTLESVSDEGVKFRKDDGQVLFVRWTRSTKGQQQDGATLPITRKQ